MILNSGMNSIIKNFTGGLYTSTILENIQTDLYDYPLIDLHEFYIKKNDNYMSNKEINIYYDTYTIMDIKQYIDKRSYSKIEKYIQECFRRFHEIYIQFFENDITTITKIALNDINIKNLISESEIMFENLIYLYNTIR